MTPSTYPPGSVDKRLKNKHEAPHTKAIDTYHTPTYIAACDQQGSSKMASYDEDGELVDFEIGDVVVLNSGGPDMTVVGVSTLVDVLSDEPPYPNARTLELAWIDLGAHQFCTLPDRAVSLVRDANDDEE